MTAIAIARPFAFVAQILRVRTAPASQMKGPMPKWIDDPQLSEKLLNDTGLAPEDLGARAAYDAKLPFFMQRDFF